MITKALIRTADTLLAQYGCKGVFVPADDFEVEDDEFEVRTLDGRPTAVAIQCSNEASPGPAYFVVNVREPGQEFAQRSWTMKSFLPALQFAVSKVAERHEAGTLILAGEAA